MTLQDRIEILSEIGTELSQLIENRDLYDFPGYEKINLENSWFTEEFVKNSFNHYAYLLTENKLTDWTKNYDFSKDLSKKTLGIIMAGNIPLVGLHDFICAYLSGISTIIKPSSKDSVLIKWIINRILKKHKEKNYLIKIADGSISRVDAIIATGNNNSNRYFEYYFSSIPSILRKNRNSIGILSGNKTEEELSKLTDDIFLYFGLGCRSVSLIYIPEDYDFNPLFKAFEKYKHLIYHHKYANNLEYQYAVNIVSRIPVLNPGNIILIENDKINSPVGVLHYKFYKFAEDIYKEINKNIEDIQCVSTSKLSKSFEVEFGRTQYPELNEYADNIDTLKFILTL